MSMNTKYLLVGAALAITTTMIPSVLQAQSISESIKAYKNRYALSGPYKKLVDNHGDGYEKLRGVRNFRAVFPGAMYRGGANNSYRKPSLSVANPLPPEALLNLCKEGFGTAVDLYTYNFDKAKRVTPCTTFNGRVNSLRYFQISTKKSRQRELMGMVYTHLQDNSSGPLYVHCQNGWHASGLVSALALRQFCGISAETAVAYFDNGIDDVHTSFNKTIRSQIRSFTPFKDLAVSEEVKVQVCPHL